MIRAGSSMGRCRSYRQAIEQSSRVIYFGTFVNDATVDICKQAKGGGQLL